MCGLGDWLCMRRRNAILSEHVEPAINYRLLGRTLYPLRVLYTYRCVAKSKIGRLVERGMIFLATK